LPGCLGSVMKHMPFFCYTADVGHKPGFADQEADSSGVSLARMGFINKNGLRTAHCLIYIFSMYASPIEED
jgi:hypothetical protein